MMSMVPGQARPRKTQRPGGVIELAGSGHLGRAQIRWKFAEVCERLRGNLCTASPRVRPSDCSLA
jgi:hypothetical protein